MKFAILILSFFLSVLTFECFAGKEDKIDENKTPSISKKKENFEFELHNHARVSDYRFKDWYFSQSNSSKTSGSHRKDIEFGELRIRLVGKITNEPFENYSKEEGVAIPGPRNEMHKGKGIIPQDNSCFINGFTIYPTCMRLTKNKERHKLKPIQVSLGENNFLNIENLLTGKAKINVYFKKTFKTGDERSLQENLAGFPSPTSPKLSLFIDYGNGKTRLLKYPSEAPILEGEDFLLNFPNEIFVNYIAPYLDPWDIASLRETSKRFAPLFTVINLPINLFWENQSSETLSLLFSFNFKDPRDFWNIAYPIYKNKKFIFIKELQKVENDYGEEQKKFIHAEEVIKVVMPSKRKGHAQKTIKLFNHRPILYLYVSDLLGSSAQSADSGKSLLSQTIVIDLKKALLPFPKPIFVELNVGIDPAWKFDTSNNIAVVKSYEVSHEEPSFSKGETKPNVSQELEEILADLQIEDVSLPDLTQEIEELEEDPVIQTVEELERVLEELDREG